MLSESSGIPTPSPPTVAQGSQKLDFGLSSKAEESSQNPMMKGRTSQNKYASHGSQQSAISASGITKGTILTCMGNDEQDYAEVFESMQSAEILHTIQRGTTLTAAGGAEDIDGYMMVPIEPTGAIQFDLFQAASPSIAATPPIAEVETADKEDMFADLALNERSDVGFPEHIEGSAIQERTLSSKEDGTAHLDDNGSKLMEGSTAYQEANSEVEINIIGARGLRKADRFGAADPFCECTIDGRTDINIKTGVAEKTVNPEWNHRDVITNYLGGSMHFVISDWDWEESGIDGRRELLGRAELRFEQCFPDGFNGDLPLMESQRDKATLTVQVIVANPQVMDVEPELVPDDPTDNEETFDAIRFVFPSASWPAPPCFAEDLSSALENLGATRLHVVALSLVEGEHHRLIAELSGPQSAIDEIRSLPLQNLVVSGHRGHVCAEERAMVEEQEDEEELATKASNYLQELGLLRAEYDTQKRNVEKHLQWLERSSKDSESTDAGAAHQALRDVTVLLEDCFATAFRAIAAAQSELATAQEQARAEVQEELDYERARADAIMAGFKRGKRRHGFATAAVTTFNLFELMNNEHLRHLLAIWRTCAKLEVATRTQKELQSTSRQPSDGSSGDGSQHDAKEVKRLQEYIAQLESQQTSLMQRLREADQQNGTQHDAKEIKKLQEYIGQLESQQTPVMQKLREAEQQLQKAKDENMSEIRARCRAEEHAQHLQTMLDKSTAASNPSVGVHSQHGHLRMLTTVLAAQKLESALSKIYRKRLVATLCVLRTHPGSHSSSQRDAVPLSQKSYRGTTGNTLERLARARAMMNNAAWEHALDAFAGKYPLPQRPVPKFPDLPPGPAHAELFGQIQHLREYVEEVDDRAWQTSPMTRF